MLATWQNESRAARCVNTVRPLTHSLDLGEEGLAMQATRTCSVTECDQVHFGLGLCRKHYNAHKYDARRVPGGRKYPPRLPCKIDGCDALNKAQGWCGTHYQRFLRTGSPTGFRERNARPTCIVAGCERLHAARGYCGTHWSRWRLNGDPEIVRISRWAGDDAGYQAVHTRLARALGAASKQSCADCGGPAAEWSYDHRDPDEKTQTIRSMKLPYSVKPEHYQPRCRSCHKHFDNRALAARLSSPESAQNASVVPEGTNGAETRSGGAA